MEESLRTRPLFGRWVALDVRPTRPLTFLGPAWAALCGAIASGGLALRGQSILFLILSLLLCDTLLSAWRMVWSQPEWRRELRRRAGNSLAARPGGIAHETWQTRISSFVIRQLMRARHLVGFILNSDMVSLIFGGALALSIAAVLGAATLILVVVTMLLAPLEALFGPEHGAWLRALSEITLSWLIAQSALGHLSILTVALAILFALVYRGLLGLVMTTVGHWIALSDLAQVGVLLLLMAHGTPIAAGIVILGLLAQVLWQARYRADHDGRLFAQRVQSYVLAAMLVAALSVLF